MPSRLRPVASVAAEAILVGDPGRSLLLAQALLEQPKMSNHARGLWGYFGHTERGRPLTVQATGMGGPSAALVLGDLAELGVMRAIRVGTCTAIDPALRVGQLLLVAEAHAWGGGGGGLPVRPDAHLSERLGDELGTDAKAAVLASLDELHGGGGPPPVAAGDATDMQTAALFAAAARLGISLAALTIVAEARDGVQGADELLAEAAERGGRAAAAALGDSPST